MPTTVPTPPRTRRPGARPRRLAALLAAAVALPPALLVAGSSPVGAAEPATITGYVEETGHRPTTGMDVYLWRADGETFVDDTVTNSGGVYTFAGLEPGSYKVEYENQQEATTEWYDNQRDKDSATVVTVGSGETARADAYLTMGSENLAVPTIAGTAAVGGTLTAARGTWYPEPNSGFTYQWTRDGVDIAGATAATRVLTAADAGAVLRVRVTADHAGTRESATSAPTAPVSGGSSSTITPVSAPVVTGTATVGSTLSAGAGQWSPSDVTVAYQWLRDGAPITGATGPTLALTAADAGTSISVRVTASRPGSSPVAQTSAATAVAAEPTLTAVGAPRVTGAPRVGVVLRVSGPGWSVTPDSLSYAWLRNGRVLPGATASSYRATPADAGARLSARVTARRGALTTAATSGSTTAVAKAPSTLKVTGKPGKGRATVVVRVGSAGAATGRVTVRVADGRRSVTRTAVVRRGVATLRFTGLRAGRKVFAVRYAGSASAAPARTSWRVTVR